MIVHTNYTNEKSWVNIPTDFDSFVFDVWSCKSAHVTLVTTPGQLDEYAYDIVIGKKSYRIVEFENKSY